jgi:hypothetical protein
MFEASAMFEFFSVCFELKSVLLKFIFDRRFDDERKHEKLFNRCSFYVTALNLLPCESCEGEGKHEMRLERRNGRVEREGRM